jgi:hypothetical protein
MLLTEWRAWWLKSGAAELQGLLDDNWDPFEDASFRAEAEPRLLDLARRLHEGATVVDVKVLLHDLRRTRWPERMGRKWIGRDRAVARKVIAWYRESTGEIPVER